MRPKPFPLMLTRLFPTILIALTTGASLAAAGCGGNKQAAAGAAPGSAAVPVSVEVVAPKPVDRTTDYIATLKSRRSSEIRPQVEGIITKIFVRSGDRVSAGTPLVQIDPAKQQATLSSDEASRAAQEAELIDREPRAGAHGTVAFIHPRTLNGVLWELLERSER